MSDFKSNSIWQKFDAIEARKAIKEQNEGAMSFGVKFLDDAFISLQKTDLITLSSYSGVGKSTLATNIALLNAAKGVRVFYIALEAGDREVNIRANYKLAAEKYFRDLNRPRNIKVKYPLYKRDKIDPIFLPYALAAEKETPIIYKTLTIIHKNQSSYTLKNFIDEFLILDMEAELIIVDHLNYFDSENEKSSEYTLLSEAIKEMRNRVLLHKIPIIVVTHLNRPDRKIKRIVPDLDDLHGSSNIGKIATGSFFISRDLEVSDSNDYPTYIRIAKNRDNGGSVGYAARMLFDESSNSYSDKYELFKLKDGDTRIEVVEKDKLPFWAEGAINGREISATTKATSEYQRDLGYI